MFKENDTGALDEVMQLDSVDIAKWNFAPRSDWSDMSETEHFVQFYEADGYLLNSVGGYIGGAIKAGQGAVVIATKSHRDGLDQLMHVNGLDVTGARRSGRYVSLDAAETLSKFMVDGLPQPALFNTTMGNVITQVTDGSSCIRAFGEMVALLWAEGSHNAAIRLEELWNDLQKAHSFSLFCAYPMHAFVGEKFTEPHDGVCSTHSRVIPAESYVGLANQDDRLREIARLQQNAKALQAEIKARQLVEERLRLALSGEQIARAQAETANRMKDEFLANVSHELRTPLNAIIGWSHLLRNGDLNETTAVRALETIDRNAKSQAQLIEDILDVSRMITGKLHLNNEPVDLAAVINSAIDSVQLAAESKEIKLKVTLDPSARHTVGDASRLQQVIWNLLANAIKFTPTSGKINVKVQRAKRNVQILVSDSGQGIKSEFLPYIFDRFRQADGTTTRQHGGLGLGLAIVRHLIELHGGTIQAESPGEGFGATFTVSLPLVRANRSGSRKTAIPRLGRIDGRQTPSPSLAGVRVLLVDDDVDTLQILDVMLAESKALVETASSAEEALALLEWYVPDVLVSDLAMPGHDGYSLIARIRSMPELKDTPAVALTSYVRVEDRARALSAGFNVFVAKPVEPAELISAIADLAEPEPHS